MIEPKPFTNVCGEVIPVDRQVGFFRCHKSGNQISSLSIKRFYVSLYKLIEETCIHRDGWDRGRTWNLTDITILLMEDGEEPPIGLCKIA